MQIFLSHASADRALAQALVAFLKEAIGVPNDAIFCSSLNDNGIPLGEDFNDYMKDQIQSPDLVILLMTETYLEREFCLMELGATWAKSHQSLPIIVPPVSFDKVSATLGLKQAWSIIDHAGLNKVKALVEKLGVILEKRSLQTWDDKRADWRTDLPEVLKSLPRASKVSRKEFDEKTVALDEARAIGLDLESQLGNAAQRISRLEKLKDAAQVAELKHELGDTDLEEKFASLLEAIRAARPDGAIGPVFMHVLMDFSDNARRIDWQNSRHEFEQAVQYKILSNDDGNAVLWTSRKLTPLHKALTRLKDFLNSEDGLTFAKSAPASHSMDMDDRAFWEGHLKVY